MFNVDESDWIKCITVMEMEGVRQRDSWGVIHGRMRLRSSWCLQSVTETIFLPTRLCYIEHGHWWDGWPRVVWWYRQLERQHNEASGELERRSRQLNDITQQRDVTYSHASCWFLCFIYARMHSAESNCCFQRKFKFSYCSCRISDSLPGQNGGICSSTEDQTNQLNFLFFSVNVRAVSLLAACVQQHPYTTTLAIH